MDILPVNITDITVIIVLLVSALLAHARGLVHEVLSVAGWVGGGLITIYIFPSAQPFVRELISFELVADLATGITLFILSLAILSILTGAISKRVQNSSLNALDRSLGFLFGLARGSILICLLYMTIEWMIPIVDQPSWLRNARSMALIEGGALQLRKMIPENATISSDETIKKANKLIESQKFIDRLISPEPKSQATGTRDGYGKKERNEMERLIDSNSQN